MNYHPPERWKGAGIIIMNIPPEHSQVMHRKQQRNGNPSFWQRRERFHTQICHAVRAEVGSVVMINMLSVKQLDQ